MVGLRQNNSESSAFAIRSGGHTLLAGAANINKAVIIDLRSINNISANSITAVWRWLDLERHLRNGHTYKLYGVGSSCSWSAAVPTIKTLVPKG